MFAPGFPLGYFRILAIFLLSSLDSGLVRFQVENVPSLREALVFFYDPRLRGGFMPSPQEFLDETNVMSLSFLERLYAEFLEDPASVPGPWKEWFLQVAEKDPAASKGRIGPSFEPPGLFDPPHLPERGLRGLADRRPPGEGGQAGPRLAGQGALGREGRSLGTPLGSST